MIPDVAARGRRCGASDVAIARKPTTWSLSELGGRRSRLGGDARRVARCPRAVDHLPVAGCERKARHAPLDEGWVLREHEGVVGGVDVGAHGDVGAERGEGPGEVAREEDECESARPCELPRARALCAQGNVCGAAGAVAWSARESRTLHGGGRRRAATRSEAAARRTRRRRSRAASSTAGACHHSRAPLPTGSRQAP